MKNEIKVARQNWIKVLVLALFLLPGVSGFSAPEVPQPLSCPIQGLTKTGQSEGSVAFSWGSVPSATEYRVYYVRTSDNYTSGVFTTGSTSISFNDLPAGTYRFYFAAVCGQESLDWIIDDVIM